jgi:hypothetical protein
MVARSRSAIVAGSPSRRVDPRTSRNASSRETTSTCGVTRRKVSTTAEDTVENRSWSAETDTACGHSRRARVEGIPDRMP